MKLGMERLEDCIYAYDPIFYTPHLPDLFYPVFPTNCSRIVVPKLTFIFESRTTARAESGN